ncbi:Histidine-containing phosphotransfer protein [Rhynchospora pubera]|uniref:Histidine-containing phosphotransfer protein n=1 Tax=Rhynchospora pubera TaxID=906938 RepID=A0AAV8F5X3_9POAL|nr:Histidine-containing phosphotransfer protein [Rhynchospora pubera]
MNIQDLQNLQLIQIASERIRNVERPRSVSSVSPFINNNSTILSSCGVLCLNPTQESINQEGNTQREKAMDVNMLQRTYSDLLTSLFREGILNQQFTELQQLQDENNPGFVYEVVSLFFEDAGRLINELISNFNQQAVDYKKIDAYVHQLKGSSASIGAEKIRSVCQTFREYYDKNDIQGCYNCIQPLNQEFVTFKSKLEALFTLEQQIVAAGGSIPMMRH